MAFFDDLTKKINDVTASAAQKTKGISEVSRLNAMINEEKAKQDNCYLQIGRLYCERHGDEGEEGFVGFINAIKQSANAIEALNAQINSIKGLITCPNCKASLAAGSAFCNCCGNAVPSRQTLVCAKCSAPLEPGMKFCTACGLPVAQTADDQTAAAPADNTVDNTVAAEELSPAPEDISPVDSVFDSEDIDLNDAVRIVEQGDFDGFNQTVPVSSVSPVSEQAAQYISCPVCGRQLLSDMLFCTECGARLK